MFDDFWYWIKKSRWRLSGSFFVIGAVNVVGFFWHYHRGAIVLAIFDAIFAFGCLAASVWYLYYGVGD